MREYGVKLKPGKFKVLRSEVKCLHRVVLSERYKEDLGCINPILNLQNSTPKIVGDIRKLMGLLGYYRQYINDFSRIAKSMYDLLRIPSKSKLKAKNGKWNCKLHQSSTSSCAKLSHLDQSQRRIS